MASLQSEVDSGSERDAAEDLQNESDCKVPKRRRRSRENTIEEKRRMRQNRKKRKHKRSSKKTARIEALEKEVNKEQELREDSQKQVVHYRRMARSYWERWQWELRQRKEAMLRERAMSTHSSNPTKVCVTNLLEIDHTLLHDPVRDGSEKEVYLGQGSFGVVKLKLFRGIKVAVKELQPRTVLSDVRNEAHTLAKLCHPFLPYLFGVCTVLQPYRIIMQFHGLRETTTSLTLSTAIIRKRICDEYAWIGISIQIMQALAYLHDEALILHNDITTSNILLTDSTTEKPSLSNYIQIVLIDFGKATPLKNSRKYNLSDIEKAEYTRKYPQIAPEVIDGMTTLTTWSDMYAAGRVVQYLIDHEFFRQLPSEQRRLLQTIVRNCQHPHYSKRLSAKQALQCFNQLMNNN